MRMVCIDNSQDKGTNSLIIGKIYDVTEDYSRVKFGVIYYDIEGIGTGYNSNRFMCIKKYRRMKLEKLNK